MSSMGERYAQISETLIDHPKTTRLARALRINRLQIIGHLTCLWNWAMKNALDGDLSRVSDRDISDAARFTDPDDFEEEADQAAGRFVAAMIECRAHEDGHGFLEQHPDGSIHIHDWAEYGGRLLVKRQSNAQRAQRHRAKRANEPESEPISCDVTETSHDSNANVTRTSRVTLTERSEAERSRAEQSIEEILPNGRRTREDTQQPRGIYSPELPLPLGVQDFIARHGGADAQRWEEELRLDLDGREIAGPPSAYMLAILKRFEREGLPQRGSPSRNPRTRSTAASRFEDAKISHGRRLQAELEALTRPISAIEVN